jgi:hypothetical protein
MQDIYNYVPERKHVSIVRIVATILWLKHAIYAAILFPMLNVSYYHMTTFRSTSMRASVQYRPFVSFLDVALSWYVAKVFSE